MTGQQDAIRDTAQRILNQTFQVDAASTTFREYLHIMSIDLESQTTPMRSYEASKLLNVLERLAKGECHLSHSQREDLKRGCEALLHERDRVNSEIDDFRIRVNNKRGDVSRAALERFLDEKHVLDDLFPNRPDPVLNEGRRVEYLEMERDWSQHSNDLGEITGLMTALAHRFGVSIDPPLPPF